MRDIFLNNSKCLQYVPLLSWWLGYCQLCSDEEIWKHLLCFFFLDVAKKDEDTYSMIHSHKDQNQERYWRGWPASPLTTLKVYGSKTSLTEQGTNPIYEKRVILFNKFCAFEPTRAYQEAEAKGAVEDNTVPCCQHEPFSFRHLPRVRCTCIELRHNLNSPEDCRSVSWSDRCEKRMKPTGRLTWKSIDNAEGVWERLTSLMMKSGRSQQMVFMSSKEAACSKSLPLVS